MSEHVWSEQQTTPTAIEGALRQLLKERHSEIEAFVPARVLNLVVVADREWQGEILNRLEGVGRYHPSRTILCTVSPGRTGIDAVVSIGGEEDAAAGKLALGHERVVVDVPPSELPYLDSIVDPLVVTDLHTVLWAPHGHHEAVDCLMKLAQVVLIDSIEEPSIEAGLARANGLAERAYVVDLAWLRSTPWRERVAASFDPLEWRSELASVSAVTVRHRPDSGVAGLLLFGWLGSRLNWKPGHMVHQDGSMHGHATARRQDVTLRLEPDQSMSAPGLAGITVETAAGTSLSLDRGPGGLTARRRTRKGDESTWTILGASRGEAGILGEGIRQALLRNPTYGPALGCARAMLA
jgi:glucose-6-phosphate dehydrogenase assembly protein OpcA